jgi:hypothetical protein
MGARQNLYAVDETLFVNLLVSTMGEVLVSLLPECRELAEVHPWSILGWWSEADGGINYYVCPDSRIKLIQNARIRYLQKDDICQAPGMSLTVRDFIIGHSSFQLDDLLMILAESRSCAFIRCIVDGERRWWIHSLLETASLSFGPQSTDFIALHGLCQKLLRFFGTDIDLRSLSFPVLPRDDGDNWMGVWTAEETEEALVYCEALLDLGVKFARYEGIGYPETEEGWDAWVRRIITQLLNLRRDGFLRPLVVSFRTG